MGMINCRFYPGDVDEDIEKKIVINYFALRNLLWKLHYTIKKLI